MTSGRPSTWVSNDCRTLSVCSTMLTDNKTWICNPRVFGFSNATLFSITPACSSSRTRRQTDVRDKPEYSASSIWLRLTFRCKAASNFRSDADNFILYIRSIFSVIKKLLFQIFSIPVNCETHILIKMGIMISNITPLTIHTEEQQVKS